MKKSLDLAAFSAQLDTDVCDAYTNADLILKLRLGFRQINPSGGAATGTYHDYGDPAEPSRKIVKWTAAAWTSWMDNFVRSAQTFWSGKFWLVNNFAELEYEKNGEKYRANVFCKLALSGADASTGTYHHVIDVVRLDPSETWFGSHSTLYDNLDTNAVQKGTDSKGKTIMQRAHIHEVGHLLGLGHVDIGKPHCPASSNTNAAACYGVADVDKYSLMGQGMQLRSQHADPWRKAISQITGKGSVAKADDWSPKRVRQYPRTLLEALANKSITVRPKRP